MINELEIHNFKSIKDLKLSCKRFNIFIGEPNTGKSNILEALGLVSFVGVCQYDSDAKLDGFVRHERLSNLFYEDDFNQELSIRCDNATLKLESWALDFKGRYFGPYGSIAELDGDIQGINHVTNYTGIWSPSVMLYRRPAVEDFVVSNHGVLLPPYGANLPSLLLRNKKLRKWTNLVFAAQGLRLSIPGQSNRLELIRSYDDVISRLPYKLASESQQRLTFYTAAMESNRGAALLFEEPETHSSPDDVHYLAEVIGLAEDDNQYFITTHSHHFLMSLICKAPAKDLAINVVYSEDHQTKVKTISHELMSELFEVDAILNWERFVEV